MDSGTTCVSPSPPPGPTRGDRRIVDPNVETQYKDKYLRHAKLASYAMQCESVIGGKGKPSFLGGKFLRMYLEHTPDPDAFKAAGEEIQATATWKNLEKQTNDRIQRDVDRLHGFPSEKEVANSARRFLKKRLKKVGIAFRGSLNSVIGGVRDIEVGEKVELAVEPSHGETKRVDYILAVTLFDTYDFANKREGEYAVYRNRLADLLKKNQFCEFEKAYWGEMCPGPSGPRTQLDSKAVLFASFMYALERRGWTRGPLPWHVTISMYGTFTVSHSMSRKKMEAGHK
jgi:hypothetical protein